MMMRASGLLASLAAVLAMSQGAPVPVAAKPTSAAMSVTVSGGKATIKTGIDKAAAAFGQVEYQGELTGWNVLDIEANTAGAHGNVSAAFYAAGYLEGALTCDAIGLFSRNNDDSNQRGEIRTFADESYRYVQHMASATYSDTNTSDYWAAVANVLSQFKGVVEGYNTECAKTSTYNPLTESEMYLMQADGDLEDLESAFPGDANGKSTLRRSYVGSSQNVSADGLRCSMLVKLKPDFSDIFYGHATWDSYSNMAPRVYKTYHLPVQRHGTTDTHTVGFSSSPSWLSSIDDWYLTTGTSELAVIETSHAVQNHNLYKKLSSKSVLCWIRTIVANTLASDGASWAEIFSYEHSGTYNNEWQVIDLEKFTPGKAPTKGDGLLTILEELPGFIHWEDMTGTLSSQLYWPSFNVPFFPETQHAAGYLPSDWSADDRHCLFEQLQGSVVDLPSMEAIMRHNDYKHDKCSKRNACTGAIACRADLEGAGGQRFGALDAKWSSYTLGYKSLKAQANAGPTHDQQPVFCWKKLDLTPHHGHPECFNFSTTVMAPHVF